MIRLAGILLPGLLLATGPASALDVYRCTDGEITVYADKPCDGDGVPLDINDKLSVIPAPEDLEQTAENNRRWMEQHRAAIAQRRADRASSQEVPPRQEPQTWYAPATPIIGPVFYDRGPGHRGRGRHQDRGEAAPPDLSVPPQRSIRATDLSRDRSRPRATDLDRDR